jgi:hypothetical protein
MMIAIFVLFIFLLNTDNYYDECLERKYMWRMKHTYEAYYFMLILIQVTVTILSNKEIYIIQCQVA